MAHKLRSLSAFFDLPPDMSEDDLHTLINLERT